jgi:branched-chain amino acid transport system permease protein
MGCHPDAWLAGINVDDSLCHVFDVLCWDAGRTDRVSPLTFSSAGVSSDHRINDSGLILETGNLALLGARRISFPSLIETKTYNVGGVFVTNQKIMIVIVSALLALALHQFIQRTRWGMAMRAISFDFTVVPLMGVPLNTIAALTFGLGSALAAAAGILFGLAYPVLDPYMGILFGWKAFVAAILGGRGSIVGATLAGFLLGFIEIFVAMIFPSTLRDLIAYSIVLIILTFRPYGFFGEPHSARLRL